MTRLFSVGIVFAPWIAIAAVLWWLCACTSPTSVEQVCTNTLSSNGRDSVFTVPCGDSSRVGLGTKLGRGE